MFKPKQQHTHAFRFRRFCRAKWAAYSSMHREVTIGRLAVRVADSSLAKLAVCGLLTSVLSTPLMAQSDDDRETRTLPEVTVTIGTDSLGFEAEPAAVLTAEDFQQSTIHSIADLVAQLPGVDLRVRGGGDVQGDLSMRGGTFDQMLVLLNGINLTDAQTGHHTLDIPIDITMVERVELLTPAQCMSRGLAAFCGAVNIVVCEEYRERLLADVSAGSYGTANVSVLGTKAVGHWALTTAAAYHRSDGYRHNTDYHHGSLFLQAVRHGETSDWLLQLGGQMKDFGSAGFYSTTYPDQYEATRTLTASASNIFKINNTKFTLSAYGRLHRDRFELFRDGMVDSVPLWYSGHNHHLSSLAGLSLRVTQPLATGEMVAGADLRREGIWSNVLGSDDSTLASPFTMSAARLSTTLFGGYAIHRGAFHGQAVALGLYNSHFGADYGLAANISYDLAPAQLHLSASRTYRLPTFTDLYYHGANQTANPDLHPEGCTHIELGSSFRSRALRFGVSAYWRKGVNIIDWVRRPESEMWYSMNHTAVDALGLDLQSDLRLSVFDIHVGYSFCHIRQDAGEWISGSALDYLRHQLRAAINVQLAKFDIQFATSYRQRVGQYVDADGKPVAYGGVVLADARVSYRIGAATLYLEGHNLLDTPWRDHGGTPQPGRTVMLGLRLAQPALTD